MGSCNSSEPAEIAPFQIQNLVELPSSDVDELISAAVATIC